MEGAGQQQAADEEHVGERGCGLILHRADLTGKEYQYLQELKEKLGVVLFDMKDIEVENKTDAKKLVKLQELLDSYDRVILAFPGSFQHAQLVQAINMMVKRQRAFVTVIMYQKEYVDFPHDLDEFKIRRIMVDKNMQDTEGIAGELMPFIKDNPENLNLAFLNFGNGLAWSYFFGYLSPMLPDLEKIIMESPWRKGDGQDVPEENICKRMLIYPKLEIMKKDLKLGRLIFHKNERQVNRAGIDRRYEIDIREVKSKDGKETYYGIADYANCLKMLIGLRNDQNVSFFDMSEEMMVKQGRYFYKRLELFLYSGCMRTYNKKYNIHPSKFELQPFDTPKSAPEEELVENLFERMKEACHTAPPVQQLLPVATQDIGTVCLPGPEGIIKKLKEVLQRGGSIRYLLPGPGFDSTLRKLKKVFMVLTDELVTSDYFEDLFYAILRHGSDVNNRRFLVCLDFLSASAYVKQPALQLLVLFKCIKYGDGEWVHKVKTELEGDRQEITYDLMFHNIGAGFALSFYYGYLHFRIPSMKNIVAGTPELKRKFDDRLMSYKLFILHPNSCIVREKVSDADSNIVDRDADEELRKITCKDITHDRRVFSPKMSSIVDPKTGKKYFVFVEYNTQAETLHRMMREGFLDESLLSAEWERFCNKLYQIIGHQREPLGLKDRLQIIKYDDTNLKNGDLAEIILARVKEEIVKEDGHLQV